MASNPVYLPHPPPGTLATCHEGPLFPILAGMESHRVSLDMSILPLDLTHAMVRYIDEDAAAMAELGDALYPRGNNAETKGTMRRQKNLDRLAELGERFGYRTYAFRFDGSLPHFDDKNSNVRLLDLGSVALAIASSNSWRPTGRKPKYRPHLIEPTSVQDRLFPVLGPPPAQYRWSRLLVVAYEMDRFDPTLGQVGRIRLRAAACDGTNDYIDLGDVRAYAALYDSAPTAEVPRVVIPLEAIHPLGTDGATPPQGLEGDRTDPEATDGTADS